MRQLSPSEFLDQEWYLRFSIGDRDWIIGQPSSSLLVFFLSYLAIQNGLTFIRHHEKQKSRLYCGIALLLSGIGSTAAGIYYQAFGYQIRCNGESLCATTSLWESLYLSLSSFGMMAFLFAVAYACVAPKQRVRLLYYAIGNTFFYQLLLCIGIVKKNELLVSYNFSLLFLASSIFLLGLLNAIDYVRTRNSLSRSLLLSYLILAGTSLSYAIYYQLGVTEWLWSRHLWLSQNDILHIGMIYWVWYTAQKLRPTLRDIV